jgi:hypothetical protein
VQQYLGDRECLGRNELPRKRYNTRSRRLGKSTSRYHTGSLCVEPRIRHGRDETPRSKSSLMKSGSQQAGLEKGKDHVLIQERGKQNLKGKLILTRRHPLDLFIVCSAKSTYGPISDTLSWARRNSRKTARTRWRRRRDL